MSTESEADEEEDDDVSVVHCPHSEDGWCLECVDGLQSTADQFECMVEDLQKELDRLESGEPEVEMERLGNEYRAQILTGFIARYCRSCGRDNGPVNQARCYCGTSLS